jgi:hypothetical protein
MAAVSSLWMNDYGLFLGLFEYALLQLFLTLNAMPCPWHRFETLGADLGTARNALAKRTFANPRERVFDHLQQPAIVVALMKEKFLGVRAGGFVGDVLRRTFVHGTAVRLSSRDHAAQILLPRLQSLLK